MFVDPTVLIVGAGASVDFGYPLGPSLLKNIVNSLESARKALIQGHRPKSSSDAEWLEYKYWHFWESMQSRGFLEAELQGFISVARNQTISSIDRFLRDHPELSKIGKYLLALEILSCTYEKRQGAHSETLHPFPRDYSMPNGLFWIQHLINELREGASTPQELQKNKITIVTFNYDVELEQAFEAQFANTSVHRGAKWQDCLEIIHVYGEVTKPMQNFERGKFLNDVATSLSTLSIIGEGSASTNWDAKVKAIRQKIISAQRLISIGFSFDPANIEVLGLERSGVGEKLSVLNYDRNSGVSRILRDLNVLDRNVFEPHMFGSKMSIAEAAEHGLFRGGIRMPKFSYSNF
jgi:hypothetical protein